MTNRCTVRTFRAIVASVAISAGMLFASAVPASAATSNPALTGPDSVSPFVQADSPDGGAYGWAQEGPDIDNNIAFIMGINDMKADSYHAAATLQIENSGGTWETAVTCSDFSGANTTANCYWNVVGCQLNCASTPQPGVQNLSSGTPFRIVVQTKSANTVESTATSGVSHYQNQSGSPYQLSAYIEETLGGGPTDLSADGNVATGLDIRNNIALIVGVGDKKADGYHARTVLQIQNSAGTWETAVTCADFSGYPSSSYCDWNAFSSSGTSIGNVSDGTSYRILVESLSGNTVESTKTIGNESYVTP